MEFKVNYKVYKNASTPVGSDDVPEFGYFKEIVDKESGKEEIVFKQIGFHSQSEYINSFADSVDLKKLMERYRAGDITALSKRVGDFMDSVGIPDNLLDAKLMIQNGEKAFAELPAKVKEQYHNDPMKFIQACQDGSIKSVIQGLDKSLETSVDINAETNKKLNDSNKKIEELQAQIAELKGVKYE